MDRVVIGVDTSLRSTGIGVVRAEGTRRIPLYYGTIRTAANIPMTGALKNIAISFDELLDTWIPTEVAVEGIFYGKNAKTMMILCHARGVILAACAKRDIPVYEYEPRTVKSAVTGYGSAEKAQVQAMMGRIFSITEPIQNDAADALAIALTHLNKITGVAALAPHTI